MPVNSNSRFFQAMLRYPPSWFVLLVTPAAVAGFIAWFQPSPAVTAIAVALGGGLFILWPPLLAADARFHQRYHRLASRVDQDDLSRLFQLEQRLRAGGSDLGQQGAATLHRLRNSFDFLSRIFVRRLHGGELAYGRYLAASEQLFLTALDNAEAALGQLPTGDGEPPLSAQQQAALEQRLGINQRIVECFDAIAEGLTEIRALKAYQHPALQPCFNELEQLSNGAKSRSAAPAQ